MQLAEELAAETSEDEPAGHNWGYSSPSEAQNVPAGHALQVWLLCAAIDCDDVPTGQS